MNDERERMASARSTSVPLILLTLLAGVALGWLLHDLFDGAFSAAPPPPAIAAPTPPPASVVPPTPPLATAGAPTASAARPTSEPTASAVRPTSAPTEPPAPTAPPATPAIAGYAGHMVAEGETLESIAAAGGSTPDLIVRYNLLPGAPQPGRALIVPQLEGRAAVIESQPLLVRRGPAGRPWVALTLDAGASAEPVAGMLETLRTYGVKLTFFLTGKWMHDNPALTRQIVADGHELANHSFNHPDMRNLSAEAIDSELADTEAIVQETAPGASIRPFFRPPYGAYDERVLRLVEAQGYLPVYWTLDSLDSVGEPKTPEFLIERVTGTLAPEQLRGAIILAHCGSQPTADALPRILDRFAELGFEVKKLSEVLGG